ncbi:hypothetical protein MJM99_34590, partial [Salmonella enterica subsp. enterica serovar Kentucky]|nr:hypothetical protein [Salmonella enterica subsp. enterica serovar Kentucky]
IAQWIARNVQSEHPQWSMAQAISLLADVERLCPQLVKAPPGGPFLRAYSRDQQRITDSFLDDH